MEKRSSERENAQLHLPLCETDQGVGARQEGEAVPQGGGGYQDVCTASKFQKKPPEQKKIDQRDPRLDELRVMGLQRPWLMVAEVIGVDALLTAWRILDADPSSSYDGTTLRVPLRSWRTYLRFQRNRYIESLSAVGLDHNEIQKRLNRQLGERVSISHIKRLLSRG